MHSYYNKLQNLFQPDKVIITKVYRIGVQSIWVKDYKFYVSIINRTYHSAVEIPMEKLNIWIEKLKF